MLMESYNTWPSASNFLHLLHMFLRSLRPSLGFPVAQLVKKNPAMWETWIQSLGWEDALEKGTAPHSSILAWRIPWTVSSMGSQRVRQN